MTIFDALSWLLSVIASLFFVVVIIASIVAAHQESKIWAQPMLPSLTAVGFFKVFLMNVIWMFVGLVGAFLTILTFPIFGNTRTFAHCIWEQGMARMMVALLVAPVEVRGIENVPEQSEKGPAPVFIANHDSQIDVAAVYYINAYWKWISKSSVMFLPGVGLLMYLSGHIMINRKSQKGDKSATGTHHLFEQSNEAIQSGTPMFFFPQGTRRLGARLPFKNGAFKVAMDNKAPLVPISLEIPLTAWNSLYPLTKANPVILTVHPAIKPEGKDIETLKKESFDTIYSVLPDYTKQT